MDTNKLRGKIVEKFGTRKAFAETLNVRPESITRILSGQQDLHLGMIRRMVDALNLTGDEVVQIFFDGSVAVSQRESEK